MPYDVQASKALRYNRIFVYKQEISLLIRPIDGANCSRFLSFCERIFYNTAFGTFIASETDSKAIKSPRRPAPMHVQPECTLKKAAGRRLLLRSR